MEELIALLMDIKCNNEQYGELTIDVEKRIDEAINSWNSNEPGAVSSHESEKGVLNDFISAIEKEFSDQNWEYLHFIAERVLENRKNDLRCPGESDESNEERSRHGC